jgi:hypothetical protein
MFCYFHMVPSRKQRLGVEIPWFYPKALGIWISGLELVDQQD